MIKVLVIGAVNTSARIIKGLLRHQIHVAGILGHEPLDPELVSGWADLSQIADDNNIEYRGFVKINEDHHIQWALDKEVDVIFAVGFSQLMEEKWLRVPKLGCIGFHPTKLPKGRGRAPLAWITLEKSFGSATFFLMGSGADDGPVFCQSIFSVTDQDDAKSVENKILAHIDIALDGWLPLLKKGVWNPIPQDEALASYYGVRKPEDGFINWTEDAYFIDRLIKASTHPHPGAYFYFKNFKINVWNSQLEESFPIKGVVGRVLLTEEHKGLLVQTGNGLLWIKNLTCADGSLPSIKVGDKLSYNVEDEIYKIKRNL